MKKIFVTTIILVLTYTQSQAACRKSPKDSISAEIKITDLKTPKLTCSMDDEKNVFKEPLSFEQKGCIISFEINKIVKGHISAANKAEDGIYRLYDKGSLCGKKPGSLLTLKLESIGLQCCAVNEQYTDTCRMKPQPHLKDEITEDIIRCVKTQVRWKITN